jgi:uncharacterized membrane protein YcaP (DUF421 family)
VLSWAFSRVRWLDKLFRDNPTLLVQRGNFLAANMRRQNVTESDVRAAIRKQGLAAMEDVEAVVLETDGTMSVIRRGPHSHDSALADVPGWAEPG